MTSAKQRSEESCQTTRIPRSHEINLYAWALLFLFF